MPDVCATFCAFLGKCATWSLTTIWQYLISTNPVVRTACAIALSGHVISWILYMFWPKKLMYKHVIFQCRRCGKRRTRQIRAFHKRQINANHSVMFPMDFDSDKRSFQDDILPYTTKQSSHVWSISNSLRGGGGAGGAGTTRRRRNEKASETAVLHGLQELLAQFRDSTQESNAVNKNTEENSSSATKNTRRARQTKSTPDSLLVALKKIVERADKNPGSLLSKLTTLVDAASKGKISVHSNTEPPKPGPKENPRPKTTTPRVPQSTPPQPRTWANVVKGPVKKPGPQPQMRLWLPEAERSKIGTVHMLRKSLENGDCPAFTIVAANHNTTEELQNLAVAHDLSNHVQIAIINLFDDAPAHVAKQWIHVQKKGQSPELCQLPVSPLGTTLPTLPKCNVAKVDASHATAETSVLRVTLPKCFLETHWRSAKSKPANIVTSILREKQLHHALINTYGWRSLENAANEPESVTGFLRITSDKVNTILALSGHHGPFFEPLAKDRGSCVVEWVSQGPHENDHEYLHRIIDTAAGAGLTYRRQGKSRLGYRLQEGSMPSSADRPRLWEAKGIPRDWNVGKLVEWLETCGWKDANLEAQPSRHRGWIYRNFSTLSSCQSSSSDSS